MTNAHQTQVRKLGRKRIIRDLRRCPRQAAEQRRLAGVRLADQPDVGDHLQFEEDFAELSRFARCELARCAIGRTGEPGVPAPAAPAVGDDHLFAMFDQVLQHVAALGVAQDRSGRHADDDVIRVTARFHRALSRKPVMGVPVTDSDQVHQTADIFVGFDDHMSPASSVSAVGTAARDVRFPAKAAAAISSVAGLAHDFNLIDEHDTANFLGRGPAIAGFREAKPPL